ncbi:MAG TPA: enoyl-CoA hydratase-related protein [Acidothermaceae bacterium]|nr:enoyl-CoA hydratase-related protein [Acidothermaceae bacterium]
MDDSAAPANPFVRLEVAGGVGTIRLDRPPVNAMNALMQDQLRAVALEAGTRDDVRAVVIYGGTRSFAAGADVKEMAAMTQADMAVRAVPLQAAFTAVAQIPKPVVAAITGYALGGGCELALAADVRFCADGAKLGQPEILLGVIPGAGGTQRLARLVGPARAKELVFTGRMVESDEALRIGLVDKLTPVGEVYNAAFEWAGQFARGPAAALRAAKEVIDRGLASDLAAGLVAEREAFVALFGTEDRTVGMTSFIESGPGKADFRGR